MLQTSLKSSGWKDMLKRSGLQVHQSTCSGKKNLEEIKKRPRETEVDNMRKTCQELKRTDVQLQWLWEGMLDKKNIYYLTACLQLVRKYTFGKFQTRFTDV